MSRAADRNRFQKDAEAKYLTSSRMDFSVGTANVTTPKEAVSKIREAQTTHKKSVPVLIMRNGSTMYLALQIT